MGLDQYLSKRIYIGAEYKHRKITGSLSLKNDGKPIKINRKRVSEIIEKVGYWRKSNQIQSTIKIIESVLLEHEECSDSDYYYKSSW